ncbi:MAG: ABC-type molybdate transport system, periplasmic component [Solidesulfovibrio magneticus str. Maddingley MBC34]|uniref:ABC-type molybdate transport system, periplasmic component n=1 Tax=Solidesulfovibrio magneticus str. Maddingley MBC34 TaxID=1206767 RepID=K6G8R4_9BACT|nr:MAG: ABC-type molybdate transport system, periplasmic component [Solidesulfovibrio magneticus str. Maddingley MBC34]
MDKATGASRRRFLQLATTSAATALLGARPAAASGTGEVLQVWSCGGLAEAMVPANAAFEAAHGAKVVYTGAFAAALGKSLLGSATTDVFAGRVLDLAKKLRAEGKMAWFKPLCFTQYVLVTPRGNPAGIASVADLVRPGVKVVLAPEASPPGGAAALKILEKAGVLEAAKKNAVTMGSCVQRTMDDVIAGRGDVSVVELRLTRLPAFAGRVDIVPIDERLFPPPPMTFTVGVMQSAKNRELAEAYAAYLVSPEGQAHFERMGFVPAVSDKGRELVEKYGVRDV